MEPQAPLPVARRAWADLSLSDMERVLVTDLRRLVRAGGPTDEFTLARFLRARRNDVDGAARQYDAAMAWRRSTGWETGFLHGADDSIHRKLDPYWKVLHRYISSHVCLRSCLFLYLCLYL